MVDQTPTKNPSPPPSDRTNPAGKSSGKTDKLFAAVVNAQAEMGGVGKSGFNKFDKYKYATLEDYVHIVNRVLPSHGLGLLTSVIGADYLPDRTTQKGNAEHVVMVTICLTLVHSSGQSIAVECVGEGQDRADKAIYKAITGARKYGLASLFGLATTDDPERDEKVGRDDNGEATSRPRAAPPAKQLTPKEVAFAAVKANKIEIAALFKAKRPPVAEGDMFLPMKDVIERICRSLLNKSTAETLGDCELVRRAIVADVPIYDLNTGARLEAANV